MLLARSCGINVALSVNGERSDFLLRRTIQNEAFTLRRDAINEAAAVGSGNQIARIIEIQNTNVRLVTLEEKAAISAAVHAEDLSPIARPNVEFPFPIQSERPNVFRLWVEEHTRAVAGVDRHRQTWRLTRRRSFCSLLRGRNFRRAVRAVGRLAGSRTTADDLVHLSIRRRGRIDRTTAVDHHRLHLQLLRSK